MNTLHSKDEGEGEGQSPTGRLDTLDATKKKKNSETTGLHGRDNGGN